MDECPICLTEFSSEEVLRTPCGHCFCEDCLLKTKTGHQWKCPYCRQYISASNITNSEGNSIAKIRCKLNFN